MTLAKRVYDERDYQVNVTRSFETSKTLLSVQGVAPFVAGGTTAATDLTITNVSFTGKVVTFRATGGTAGRHYDLRIRFTTSGTPGEVIEEYIGLVVD